MGKQYINKAAITLLAASLAFGTPALAAETGTGTAANSGNSATATNNSPLTRFPDVPVTHWASKYITKLALLNIVEGNEKGQYEPATPVSQEQVITMLVRMLGWEDEAKKLPAFASDLEVASYAKPYLHMALQKGLISYTEESSTSGKGWGARHATREWVAKLVIKAIGKSDEAAGLDKQSTIFTDDPSISSWARGYINEAVALKIVNGLEDGSFKPANPVTRAEMATFLSRGGLYADPTSISAIGIIESADAKSVLINNDLGDQTTFSLGTNAIYYGLNQDTPSTASVLKQGSRAFFVVKSGTVVYAEIVEENAKSANVLEGTLVQLNITDAKVVLQAGGKEVTAQIQIPVSIVDKDGKGLASSVLEPGSVLELHRTGSKAKYSSIIVKHIPVNKTDEGIIQSVDLANRKLSVLETGGTVAQYTLADQVTFLDNNVASDLNVLKARDKIKYRIATDRMSEITMVQAYEPPSDKGKILSLQVDNSMSYITLQNAANKPVSYNVLNNVEVVISGLDYASTKDLVKNDEVKVMLTDNNDVSKIIVTNRSLKTQYFNTIISYAQDSRILTVKDNEGSPTAYLLSDSTIYELGGTTVNYNAISSYLTSGKRVDITASSTQNVQKLKFVYSYEGTVARVMPEQNELLVRIADQQVTFKLFNGSAVELPNKPRAPLYELAVGDKVRLSYDATSNTVNTVQALKTVTYRLKEKNPANRQLTFIDANKTVTTSSLMSGTRVYNSNQNEIAINDMPLDEYYYVTYVGTSIDKVVAAPVTRGAVTAVDTATGKITVSGGGSVQKTEIPVQSNTKIRREGLNTSLVLADIKQNDRVEAVKEADGSYTIYIAAVLTKQVQSYDSSTKSLYVFRDSLNDKWNYTFHSAAYIHSGMLTLSPAGLANQDKVVLYIVDDKIIELEKN